MQLCPRRHMSEPLLQSPKDRALMKRLCHNFLCCQRCLQVLFTECLEMGNQILTGEAPSHVTGFSAEKCPHFWGPGSGLFKACFLSKCCLGPEIVSFVSSARMFLFDCLCNILVCLRCRFSGPNPVNLFFIWV